MNFKPIVIFLIILVVSVNILSISTAYAHLEHLPHYNGGGDSLGRYYVNQALEPEYAKPGEPAHIEFSIQDYNNDDVYNVQTMVEIYESNTGQRIELFPWTVYRTGDFEVHYTFNTIGNYFVVVSLADENSIQDHSVAPRNILQSTFDCDCERAVFNISITPSFGIIWNSVMTIAILLPMIIFGTILATHFLTLKKKGRQPEKQETVKYSIMLLALAAGIMHMVVYSDHGGLRIEYSIFLLVAATSQIAFGALYVLMTLIEYDTKTRESIISHYHNTVLINMIGLVGTMILLGLYLFVIVFPPPLSPDNQPEEVEFDAMLTKSLEFVLLIGILYLMKYEKRKEKILLKSIST